VVATVSGPDKAAHARAMGATHVVNYREGDPAAEIRAATGGRGIDRIVEVEFGGNITVTRAVLKDNGIIAAYGSMAAPEPVLPFYPMLFAAQTLRTVLVYKLPDAARHAGEADLARWLGEGALRHPVAAEFRPEDVAAAHELTLNSARIGAVLVRFANDEDV
jgi:NADPH:quinone reductase-like Zn-dependent oxidoreductase